MTDEIFEVMKHFNGSFINQCGELIISRKGNVYFAATDCKNKEDVICKLLEWCSRPIAKGSPYTVEKKNTQWRNSLLCGYNNYLGTNFTGDDMWWIYDKLGNAVNHELTLKFIHNGFDLSLVKPSNTEWIPTSKRYPKAEDECNYFLVTDDKGKIHIEKFYLTNENENRKPYFSSMKNVVAWMPLPAPYKKGE